MSETLTPIQKVLESAIRKENNGVISLRIGYLARVYVGVDPFYRRKYSIRDKYHTVYGSSDVEVVAKAVQFLKEHGYDQ